MLKFLKSAAGPAALALVSAASVLPSQAAVLDFEDPALTALYFPGETFHQAGFEMTQRADSGTVDVGSALGAAAPTNNSKQFYSSQNDGYLTLSRQDRGAFNLSGFSAAFVPLIGAQTVPQTIVFIAMATTMSGDRFSRVFSLGDTTSTTSGSAFSSFGRATDFSAFTNLMSVDFYTCVSGTGILCSTPTRNNGQFALDDVHVTAVPEPSTYALMALGLVGLGLARRRHNL